MILKIDHVAISSKNIEADAQQLESIGYKLGFIARDVPNLSIKAPFLHQMNDCHHLAYLHSSSGYNLELTDHGSEGELLTYITPVFEGNASHFEQRSHQVSHAGWPLLPVTLCRFDLRALASITLNQNCVLKAIVVQTANLEMSVRFWIKLGFQVASTTDKDALLRFWSPVDGDSKFLILVKDDHDRRHYLDDCGLNCVAIVSSSARAQRVRLGTDGYAVTDLADLELNGRHLHLFFCVGPGGEVVEILDAHEAASQNRFELLQTSGDGPVDSDT